MKAGIISLLVVLIGALLGSGRTAPTLVRSEEAQWIQLFNGEDLADWDIKNIWLWVSGR